MGVGLEKNCLCSLEMTNFYIGFIMGFLVVESRYH